MALPMGGSSCPALTTIPNSSLQEFSLPLTAFDVTSESKSGCGVVAKQVVVFVVFYWLSF